MSDITQAYLQSLEDKAKMATTIDLLKAEFESCRIELCIRCGRNITEYLGSCDGCKWHNYEI